MPRKQDIVHNIYIVANPGKMVCGNLPTEDLPTCGVLPAGVQSSGYLPTRELPTG